MLERIGKVAYCLRLPEGSKVHPVFHVSQLKPVIGKGRVITPLPETLSRDDELLIEPDELLGTRYDVEGHLEVLVSWKNLPSHENSWMRLSELKHQFPTYSLEDKLVLQPGGIDMPTRVYISKRQRRINEGMAHGSAELAS